MSTAVEVIPFEPKAYLATLGKPETLAYQNELAGAYDAACRALLGPNDVVKTEGRVFKTKSAWLKLARHFGISAYVSEDRAETVVLPDGSFLATVAARAIAPWGQTMENLGACSTDEATGRRVITKADAVATAATRALNRAISNLIAMGEVSAEEIGDRKPQERGTAGPPAKSPNALTWKGKNMHDMDSKDLVGLRQWFVKQDPEKWKEKIEAVDEVLASREGE
jgi:hypothetical protein